MVDLVRGTKDLFGSNLSKHKFIIQTAEKICEKHNFQELQTPIMEKANLFTKALDSETDIMDKEIYLFQDKGQEWIALRPEFTACVMRYMMNLDQNELLKIPHKIFSSGPLFRYERPQAGRQRQFSQINFEIFGSESMLYDAELIFLAITILNQLKIFNYQIKINYLGDHNTKLKYENVLYQYFSQHKSMLSEISQKRLEYNILRILDSKDPNDKAICINAPGIDSVLLDDDKAKFKELKGYLKALEINYVVDNHLVRGLNYYTGPIFEFVTDEIGAQSAILGGGRYDNLYTNMGGKLINGKNLFATGFAAGIERLSLLMTEYAKEGNIKICLIPFSKEENTEALIIANLLRGAIEDLTAEIMSYEAFLKKKLEMADKLGMHYVIVIGQNEIKSQIFSLRNMKTKEIYQLNIEGIINILK